MSERPFNNSNLFSNHYLERLVQRTPEWDCAESLEDIFDQFKEMLLSRIDVFKSIGEPELEDALIKPLLKSLGHHFGVQVSVEGGRYRPDYGFFSDQYSLDEAYIHREDFYHRAIAVGDAKRWTISLDQNQKNAKGRFEMLNPSYQIDTYLRVTPPRWAILTNGHKWRLYHQDTSYKLDSYYEIDLISLFKKGDVEDFKYFYLFFRRDAFLPDPDGRSFLDRVKDESIAYAREIGDDLKENVYKAMKVLAEGFLAERSNQLDASHVWDIQENSLRLLYRLLFIFYAESRKLLNTDNRYYGSLSIQRLALEVAEKLDGCGSEGLIDLSTTYWSRLNDLFILINEGSEARGYPKEEFYTPPYNGGLFDPDRNPFLNGKRVGDLHIAKAIDLLARSGDGNDRGTVDYSSLDIRHLGSIYEGLLEYRLEFAEGDLVAVKQKGKEVWIPNEKAEGRSKVLDQVSAGGVYLVTDNGERKTTGSYYTPDYIVKYIVENTLKPIIDEKKRAWMGSGTNFSEHILSIKVLDPAMGSGHFLVEATDRLAHELVKAWAVARPEDDTEVVAEHDIHWARREVVRNCIYGVDLNPMAVELAKLSLWLTTVASNKPLNFLDHHLRCGNSLVGAELNCLTDLPGVGMLSGDGNGKGPGSGSGPGPGSVTLLSFWDRLVKDHADALIGQYKEIASTPDDDLATVKAKEAQFKEIQSSELNRRLQELADVWLSTYFGNKVSEGDYLDLQNHLSVERVSDWSSYRAQDWFRQAQEHAANVRFFHWELEFPEAFFEGEAGFDAVVGNPPYVRQEALGELKGYFQNRYQVYHGVADLYVYFVELGMTLLGSKGQFSYILANKWMRANYGEPIRRWMKERRIEEIVDFGDLPVFPEATTYPCILRLSAGSPQESFCASEVKTLDFARLEDYVSENGYLVNLSGLEDSGWSLVSEDVQTLLEKLRRVGIPLGEYVDGRIYRGILTGLNEAFVIDFKTRERLIADDSKSEELIKPFLAGRDIKRYEPPECDKYLILIPNGWTRAQSSGSEGPWGWLEANYPAIAAHLEQFSEPAQKRYDKGEYWWELRACDYYDEFEKPKIVIPAIVQKASYAFDIEGNYSNDKTSIIPIDNLYILSLLNSNIADYVIYMISSTKRGGYFEYKPMYVQQIPIRRINFTTPEEERHRLASELKELYSAQKFEPLLERIDELLPKDETGQLVSEGEKSDVVHDLLAFLAEKMMEMNRQKQDEIKGFLQWLEGDMGAEVSDLTNKGKVQAYYELEAGELLAILKKNKRKVATDYSARKPQDRLKKEFESSVNELRPLLDKIEETDRLIDQVVYKLYGLTDQEIEIVEETTA